VDRRPIRLLDPSCVERIAAGEVLERPASAVKELVENAIDARATRVLVRIARGGLEEIVVEDDGEGIPSRELPLAVERHATSKIAGSGDLTSILSFGFRGEALASIASVSRFSLRSRSVHEEIGGRLDMVGGRLEKREPMVRHAGTTVVARDLFFNVPARREFLRSDVAERRAVTQVITALALAHPHVGFRLECDEAVVYDLPAVLDLETRVHGVFGSSVAERLRRFEGEVAGMKVEGVTSLPTYTRGNRSGHHLYVNRRSIFDKGLAHALTSAYRDVLAPGRFSLTVLFLEVPPSRVDVNVHPTKAEVRLRDDASAHALVRHAVRGVLGLQHEPGELRIVARTGSTTEPEAALTPEQKRRAEIEQLVENATWGPSEGYVRGQRWSQRHESPTLFGPEHVGEDTAGFRASGAPVDPGIGALTPSPLLNAAPALEGGIFWQLHNTFILTQIRGALVIVDQHNSHKRILYDQGKRAIAEQNVPIQQLLFPTTLDLTPDELAVFEVHRGDLEKIGFLTEAFGGNTVLVRGIPSGLRNWNDGALLRDMLGDLGDGGRAHSDPRDAILASMSCHGAIRAGERLTLPEMQALMDQLFATELPYSCPHGRPTLVRIGLPELERRFGRR
jgi:DNA mismatch repair protein MutL